MRLTGSKKNLKKLSIDANERKACIELNNPTITVKRQAELLQINRTSVYRKPALRVVSDSDIRIMHLIDELHTQEPTWGYRTITTILRRDYCLKMDCQRSFKTTLNK